MTDMTDINLSRALRIRRAEQMGQSCDRAFGIACARLGLDPTEALKAPLECIALARMQTNGRVPS